MKVIKSTQYYDILVSEDGFVIEVKWKKTILDMLSEEYQRVLIEAYNHLFGLAPTALLQNTKDAVFPLTPEFQEWITENITKKIFKKVGLKKIAYLIPSDLLTKLGIEMLVNKAQKKSGEIPRRFFDNRDDALAWLQE